MTIMSSETVTAVLNWSFVSGLGLAMVFIRDPENINTTSITEVIITRRYV